MDTILSYVSRLKMKILGRPYFKTRDVKIGSGVSFGKNVIFNCKRVRIGSGVIFQNNVLINADEFEIGDYGTIYFSCFFPGPGKIKIGHNFWLGNNSIIDSQGCTTIGNNVGIGAHSQLWTHMQFGDVVAGCRFNSIKPLNIEDDVWLVGHNLVSPVNIGKRSLAMLGSLIVKDIPKDRIVAGVPAKDITDKFGKQFTEIDINTRMAILKEMIENFSKLHNIKNIDDYVLISSTLPKKYDGKKTVFDVSSRRYYKTGSKFEQKLIRFLLPKSKFIPANGKRI